MKVKDCHKGMIVKSLKVCGGYYDLAVEERRRHAAKGCYVHSLLRVVRVIYCTSKVMVTGSQVREQYRDYTIAGPHQLIPFETAVLVDVGELMRAPEGR